MSNIINLVSDFVKGLTSILISVLALGVVTGIVFGNTFFVGDVVGNLTALVQGLGDSGLVGLIVAIILINLCSSN